MHSKQYLIEVCTIAGQIDPTAIERMVAELVSLRERQGRLFVIGLGGSAANASHAVNDFRKLCGIEAYAPTDNVAELTARANDEGWDTIFTSWLEASHVDDFLDCVLVLSVGGGTETVSAPIAEVARLCFVKSIRLLGIVGRDGGATAGNSDCCCIIIPTVKESRVTPHTEAFQSVILHCLVSHPDLQIKATKW